MTARALRLAPLAALALLGLAACGTAEPPTSGGAPTVRRLTESQYRNIIVDVFGSQIVVAGRFDPIVRTDGLLAVGASRATITPSGVERFAQLARSIAEQVVAPGNRELLLPCTPAAAAAPDDACARQFLSQAGRYLFRRKLADDEVATLVKLAAAGAQARGDFYAGLSYPLQSLLAAPDFLFVSENAEPNPDSPKLRRLDGYSKAARLSFLLWNSSPDETLLAAAESGTLATEDGLETQVERMMSSPRFQAGTRAFFTDMLGLDDFTTLEKDSLLYPAFSLAASDDSREQLLRTLVDELLTRDGDYRDLFTTRRTFMSSPLGMVYRVPVSQPGAWAPYEFPESDTRAGIHTLLSFVALHSHPGKSSPTLRGKAIRELLLCQKVPDPPSTVNFDQFNDPKSPNKTARNRLKAHSVDPACAGCHKLMDPIGLALEHFDGAGQTRFTENGEPIDPSGDLNGIAFTDAVGLGAAMRQDPAATSCVVRRAYSYAAARPVERGERDWITHLEQEFADDGFRFRQLIKRIALSDALYAVGRPAVQTAANERPVARM